MAVPSIHVVASRVQARPHFPGTAPADPDLEPSPYPTQVTALRSSLTHLTSHLSLLTDRLARSESSLAALSSLHARSLTQHADECAALRALCAVWEGRFREEKRAREEALERCGREVGDTRVRALNSVERRRETTLVVFSSSCTSLFSADAPGATRDTPTSQQQPPPPARAVSPTPQPRRRPRPPRSGPRAFPPPRAAQKRCHSRASARSRAPRAASSSPSCRTSCNSRAQSSSASNSRARTTCVQSVYAPRALLLVDLPRGRY